METRLIRSENSAELVREARLIVAAAAQEAVEDRGRFTVALSGGTTPIALYRAMAEPEFAAGFPWHAAHFFWGDERWVRPDSPRSNFGATVAALPIDRIPASNLHPVPTDRPDPHDSAQAYEDDLRLFFGARGTPVFDLILLGLGEDGHTASLFPGEREVAETERFVVAACAPAPDLEQRVTLTLPVINAAREVLFLVSGGAKASALRSAMRGDRHVPAALVKPSAGRLTWLVDEAASSLLQ